MSTFTIQNLTGDRALVNGTDSFGTTNKAVLDASQWNGIKAHESYKGATEDFDTAVEEFFKPLTEAAEKLEAAGNGKAMDPATYYVLHEEVESVVGQRPVIEHLTNDSVVLRLIERGETNRLVWVGDSLEVLEVLPETSTPSVNDALATLGNAFKEAEQQEQQEQQVEPAGTMIDGRNDS